MLWDVAAFVSDGISEKPLTVQECDVTTHDFPKIRYEYENVKEPTLFVQVQM